MSETQTKILNNRLNRQVVVSTSATKSPDSTFAIPPKGAKKVALTQEQVDYIQANYDRHELIVS